MAFTCEKCGARSTDVKTGGGISAKGKKITLKVENPDVDLNRDIFKSETTEVIIKELDFSWVSSSSGGVYSTVEGLLVKIVDTLRNENPFMGDSAESNYMKSFNSFIDNLEMYRDGKKCFTLILDDLDNCFIQHLKDGKASSDDGNCEDPSVTYESYERSFEQNEELGINQMDVEDTDVKQID